MKKSRGKALPRRSASVGKGERPLGLRIDPQANLPVHAQIRQQLTWLIASDKLAADQRLPNVRELARELGINVRTVSQAYHALEQDGLIESRPRRGTRVLEVEGRQPVRRTSAVPSHTVGVLLPNLTPFYDQFLHGLEETANRLGFLLMICFTHDDRTAARTLTQQLVAKGVDGLIAVATGKDVDSSQLPGTPQVYVDVPEMEANAILFNLDAAGYQATRHLIWHGHRRIGLITTPLSWHNNRQAARGYRRALRQAGLRINEKWIVEAPRYSSESGYEAAGQLLELPNPPTAVFVSGDVLALAAMRALREAGRRIPQDIAIASKDNIEYAALSEPPLTTVSLPVFEAGVESMRLLHSVMTDGAQHKTRVLPGSRLVVRRSCGCE